MKNYVFLIDDFLKDEDSREFVIFANNNKEALEIIVELVGIYKDQFNYDCNCLTVECSSLLGILGTLKIGEKYISVESAYRGYLDDVKEMDNVEILDMSQDMFYMN